MGASGPWQGASAGAPGEDQAELPIRPGDLVAGKFRVERLVARGGMGVVFEATHTELQQRVALKLIRPSALGNPEVVERFKHEARAAAKLQNEHIARVMDVGSTEHGIPYMVLEYLEGEDLGRMLARGAVLEVRDAVDFVIQACEGLAEAHAHGIVHRDVKPENLFVVSSRSGRPSIKLLDFGISKSSLRAQGAAELRQTTGMLGTPLYMSPEHVRSARTVDHRSDIWSLGAVSYELLSGRPPFLAESLTQVCASILEDEPTPIAELRPDVDPELARVVARCLAKDPAARYENVAELAVALLPFAHPRLHASVERLSNVLRAAGLTNLKLPSMPPPRDSHPLILRLPSGPRPYSVSTPITSSASAHPDAETVYASTLKPTKQRGRRLLIGVLAGFAVLALGAWLALAGRTQSPSRAATASEPPSGVATVSAAPTASLAEPAQTGAATPTLPSPRAEPTSSSAPNVAEAAATAPRAAPARPSKPSEPKPKEKKPDPTNPGPTDIRLER